MPGTGTEGSPQTTTVSLNQYATVKLTDRGRKVWRDHWQQYAQFGLDPADADSPIAKDGTLREQVWEIMKIFGSHVGMGVPSVFEQVAFEVEPFPTWGQAAPEGSPQIDLDARRSRERAALDIAVAALRAIISEEWPDHILASVERMEGAAKSALDKIASIIPEAMP